MMIQDSCDSSFLGQLRARASAVGVVCCGALLVALAGACDVDGGDGGDGDGVSDGDGGTGAASGDSASGGGGSASGADLPSDAAVETCRNACDRLQFFDCIGASQHETCWLACADRPEDDSELFAACVDNEAPDCNNTCLERFLDTAPVDPTGASTGECVSACESYFASGCELPDFEGIQSCEQFCDFLGAEAGNAVAACLNLDACELDEACIGGGEEGGGEEGGGEEGGGEEGGGGEDG